MARECVGEWPPAVLIQGGLINGDPVPPMTFLARILAERRGQLGDGGRASAVLALMNFDRLPRGRIGDFLA
eukprot:3573672-Pyramimonas_sp.AAC.1